MVLFAKILILVWLFSYLIINPFVSRQHQVPWAEGEGIRQTYPYAPEGREYAKCGEALWRFPLYNPTRQERVRHLNEKRLLDFSGSRHFMISLTHSKASAVGSKTNSCPLPADLNPSSLHAFRLYEMGMSRKNCGKSQILRLHPGLVRTLFGS